MTVAVFFLKLWFLFCNSMDGWSDEKGKSFICLLCCANFNISRLFIIRGGCNCHNVLLYDIILHFINFFSSEMSPVSFPLTDLKYSRIDLNPLASFKHRCRHNEKTITKKY